MPEQCYATPGIPEQSDGSIRFPSVSHPFPTHPMREPSGWTSHLSPFCAHSWPTAPPERFEHSILFHAGTPPKKNDHLEMVSTTRKGDG